MFCVVLPSCKNYYYFFNWRHFYDVLYKVQFLCCLWCSIISVLQDSIINICIYLLFFGMVVTKSRLFCLPCISILHTDHHYCGLLKYNITLFYYTILSHSFFCCSNARFTIRYFILPLESYFSSPRSYLRQLLHKSYLFY